MGDGYKIWSACCHSSKSSFKLFLFMVPLIVASGFVCVLGPKNFNWVLISSLPSPPPSSSSPSSHPPSSSSSSSSSSSIVVNTSMKLPDTQTKETEDVVDLKSRVVMVDFHSMEEEEAVLNRSSDSPPLPLEVDHGQQHPLTNETKVEINLNISTTGSTFISESDHVLHKKSNRERVHTNLERLEAGLQRSRAAIKEATNGDQIEDPDYVPLGPMYWDAKAFHRSYLEMEKQFKIFVYKEGEPPLFHDGPCKSIYSMEGNFINKMEIESWFRTKDPEKAHVFYLPFSVVKMVRFVYERDSRDFHPIRNTIVDYVNLVAGRYPYWNRSLGADHFMLSCHDWGPEASFSLPYLQKNSIRALCNANTSERFNPTKDVTIPEINLQTGKLTGLVGGPSPSQRPTLAFFAGGVHGPIRPVLLEHWENKDEDIKVHKYLPKGVSYYDMMRKSKFCLCPSGYEVASPRIAEALYSGCVPVLISVNYVPPFSDVLNWKSFSVQVSVSDIPNLKKILMGISSRQYIRMQRRVLKVRRHFVFNSPHKRFDVFHMILHSVWLRRLNIRIGDYQ